MRAAKRFRAEVIGLSDESTTKLAEIIDRETGVADLVRVLGRMIEVQESTALDCTEQDWIETRRVLAKATSRNNL